MAAFAKFILFFSGVSSSVSGSAPPDDPSAGSFYQIIFG